MSVTDWHLQDHPSSEDLRNYAAGHYDEISAVTEVENHLLHCTDCLQRITELAPDPIELSLAELASQQDLLTETTAPRFELIEEIGRGGSGIVWRARQKGLDRPLAVKLLLTGSHASPSELARFRREAQALASLNHPNIVQIYDSGEHNGTPYLAMELVEGPILAVRLKESAIDIRTAAAWVRDLALALDFAHRHQIFHRDLKPHNVLLANDLQAAGLSLDRNRIPKLIDFGLAQIEQDHNFRTKSGETLGTPAYMAPELLRGPARDLRDFVAIDIYGLGTVLYQCLTGRPPFHGSSNQEILLAVAQQEPTAVHLLRSSVPRDLITICHRCLAKESAKRFASMRDLADDLDRFLAGMPIASRPTSFLERAIRWCRRNPWKAGAASLAILILIATPIAATWHNTKLKYERRVAQERYELTRGKLWQILDALNQDQVMAIPGATKLSSAQTEAALTLFQELAAADSSDRAQLDLARAHTLFGTLANIRGAKDQASQSLQRAIELCARIDASSPDYLAARTEMAAALNKLALSQSAEKAEVSTELMQRALAVHQELFDLQPENPVRSSNLAWSLLNLSSTYQSRQNFEKAIPLASRAAEIWEGLVESNIEPDSNRESAAAAHINLGTMKLQLNDLDSSAEHFRQAIDELELLFSQSPLNFSLLENLTNALLNFSNCLGTKNDLQSAVEANLRARELLLPAIARDPERQLLKTTLFLVTANAAHWETAAKNHHRAVVQWQEAADCALNSADKLYCRQMHVLSLVQTARLGEACEKLEALQAEINSPNEIFLQALAWARIAQQPPDMPAKRSDSTETCADANVSSASLPAPPVSDAAEKSWMLLQQLKNEGKLSEAEFQSHLRESPEWKAVQNARDAAQWNSLFDAP